jgi:hypothetical protein
MHSSSKTDPLDLGHAAGKAALALAERSHGELGRWLAAAVAGGRHW